MKKNEVKSKSVIRREAIQRGRQQPSLISTQPTDEDIIIYRYDITPHPESGWEAETSKDGEWCRYDCVEAKLKQQAEEIKKLSSLLDEAEVSLDVCISAFNTTENNEEILPYEKVARRAARGILQKIKESR